MFDTRLDEAKSVTTPPERLIKLAGISTELARAVAANQNAPSKLLQKLSKFDDLETRQNVAGNPNTAIDILLKLGKDFPEEFLNNPILGLLLLENPNFIESIPTHTFIELLRVGDVPLFVEWGLKAPIYSNWRLAIASNPNTTKEVLLQLYNQSPKTNIAQVALLHVNWKGEITEDWDEAAFIEIRTCGYISRNKIKEQLLQELDIIPEYLRPYSEDYRYIISLYKHSISTYKYLDILNKIPFISKNTYKVLEILNNKNKSIDSSTITTISFSLLLPYWLTQSLIKYSVKNKKKTLLLLFILALLTIISPPLAIALVKLILALVTLILLLSLFTIFGILFALIAVITSIVVVGLALIVLIFIIDKLHSYIKNYKQKRLDQRQLSKYNNNIYKQDLETAINPNTSPRILFELASSRWLEVREAVALNPNADAEVLKKLAQDEPLKLQIIVAKHSNTPVEVLIEFAKSKSVEKKIAVAKNLKTPLSALKYLALSSKKYETVCPEAIKTIKQCYPEELTNILVGYVEKTPRPSAARLFLLLHKTAPSHFLARHYRSLDWRERYAVAQNPNTPINILEKLRLDANCIVRATAKTRF